jgi:ERCC4-related helicase
MQAFRNEAAIIKAPKTVQEAIPTLEKGEKIMIFTDFKDSLETIQNGLQAYFDQKGKGEKAVVIRGGMRKKTRREAIELFKNPTSNARAIVINIVAGGTGLDFPNIVTQAIVNDYDWSVSNDEQMLGRNYRINSLHDVYVKYMIAEGTPDEEYYQRLVDKKKIADVIHKMSREEDARLKDGERGDTSEELAALQKALAEMKKRYIQMEQTDAAFENNIAKKIKGEIKKKANRNWYSNRKFGK